MNNSLKKNKTKIVFLTIVLLVGVLSILKKINQNYKINKNTFISYAKVTKHHSNRSATFYYYDYYFNNKKLSSYIISNEFQREKCVGKYYKLEISTKNPSYSRIFLDQEVTDTLLIRKAGFDLE
ncbi:MAG: hypothetical protein ACK4UK_01550 [Flavobacterium sp.]